MKYTKKQATVVVAANTAWNLYTRKPLLTALKNYVYGDNQKLTVVACASEDEFAPKIESELGIQFIPLPMKSDSTKIFEDIRLFFTFMGIYAKMRPVVAFHINNKPNIYGTIAANICGVPSHSNITGLGIVAEKQGMVKKLLYLLYKIAFLPQKAAVFFQNEDDYAFFMQENIISAHKKVVVLPGSGVDVDVFKPAEVSKRSVLDVANGAHFLFSGRLLRSKGIEVFLEAANIVLQHYPAARFSIIGEHESDNDIFISTNNLEAATAKSAISYHGKVADVLPFLREADCVVLPSWYREGVPRALLEAGAMGKALIACDSVGTREPVQDGKNGFLVEAKNVSDLAQTMIRYIKLSASEKRAMSLASRSYMEQRFSVNLVVKKYIEALDAHLK